MNEYKILQAKSAYDLAELVNEAICEGWLPVGGVAISRWFDGKGNWFERFIQAMTK
jgi:hypothetical protein